MESAAMTNPYAPPRAAVRDIVDPSAHLAPADRGARLGAAILDGLVMFGMVYAPLFAGVAVAAATGDVNGETDTGGMAFAVGGVLTLAGFITWCWLTIRYVKQNGQSIGKKFVNIKVVRTDGSPISLGRLFWLRNVVNALIGIVPLYGLIDLLFIFGENRQCLHDKLADTIVIKA
jgi:uncharacterized RDD family membrane protein YckC